ncbi:MAG: hypothetical protein HWE20_14925 [Gammaproteobacteria bacterium]|nr:hypothetical protein [Gammaproteobacteria bacterium]
MTEKWRTTNVRAFLGLVVFMATGQSAFGETVSAVTTIEVAAINAITIESVRGVSLPTILSPNLNETVIVTVLPTTEASAAIVTPAKNQLDANTESGLITFGSPLASAVQVTIDPPSLHTIPNSVGNTDNAQLEILTPSLGICPNGGTSSCLPAGTTTLPLGAKLTLTGPASGRFTLSASVQFDYN